MNELTEDSAPGAYTVVTVAGSTYWIVLDADRGSEVARINRSHGLQYDGAPMPGVVAFHFRVGVAGVIWWWRSGAERDIPPGAPYAGTFRHTSTVVAIERLRG